MDRAELMLKVKKKSSLLHTKFILTFTLDDRKNLFFMLNHKKTAKNIAVFFIILYSIIGTSSYL